MPNKRFILQKLPEGAEIRLSGDLTVGRSPASGLRLTEGSPSREHAMLSISDGSVFVEDQGSKNGTFVNGKRIDTRVKLKSNDKVRFDVEQYLFRVEWDEAQPDETVQRTPEADLAEGSGRIRRPPVWLEDPKPTGDKTLIFSREQKRVEQKRIVASGAVEAAFSGVEVPQLVVLGGPDGTLRIELRSAHPGQTKWSVGSEGERELLLKRAGVSALHAEIVNEGERWQVIDQFSANGTCVNGRPCTRSFLNSGDRITFGPVECIFQLPKGWVAAQSAAPTMAVPRLTSRKKVVIIGILITLGILIGIAYIFRSELLALLGTG
jgi:pSer/pThr/pTyr-binding forkhead associated (FHA) protein